VIGILLVNLPAELRRHRLRHHHAYAVFTVVTTNWRTVIAVSSTAPTTPSNASAVDGLINYEVVKAFANEGFERRRLDGELEAYERARREIRGQPRLSQWRAGRHHRLGRDALDDPRGRVSSAARSPSATSCCSTPSSSQLYSP
jgi:hypothetical protein